MAVVHRVERLLKTGMPQRAVARKVGISRVTVGTIAKGQHSLQRNGPQMPDRSKLPVVIAKCGVCGVRVEMPCHACTIRAWIKDRKERGGV